MKTNKEKSLNMLIDYSKCFNGENLHKGCEYVSFQKAQRSIELASKPDWYYPNKGEYPESNRRVVTNEELVVTYNKEIGEWLEYLDGSLVYDKNKQPLAWSYLPKYEE